MPGNTDQKRKRTGAVLSALVVILFLVILLGVMGFALLAPEGAAELWILGLYAVIILAVIAGVAAALVQRLRELRRGEEEDAKKY